MIIRILAIFIILAGAAYAGQGMGPGPGVKGYSGGSGCAYSFCEGFENTGYENTWTETIPNGTCDEDYTTTVLDGSQSLYVSTADYRMTSAYTSFTPSASVYVYGRFRVANYGSDNSFIVQIADASGNVLASLMPFDWSIVIAHGSVSEYPDPEYPVAVSTTYHWWLEYTAGSGSNGVLNCYMSTTATKPGTATATITTGTSTANAARIYLVAESTHQHIFDKIRYSTSAPIGSNPE